MKYLIEMQKSVVTSRATLPLTGLVSVVIWLLFAYGESFQSVFLGLILSACSVYLIAELNNSNSLLRNGSRMLSCIATIILTVIPALHSLSVAHVLMLLYVLSLFFLFKTTQISSPFHTFFIYLLISAASILFPKMLLCVPVYWLSQVYMRSISLRCFVASILAVITPYWIYSAYFIYYDDYASLLRIANAMVDFQLPDYSSVSIEQLCQYLYLILFLILGVVDFYININKDKVKVRFIYAAVIWHSLFGILFISLQPQNFYEILPLLIVNTAIVSGHYFALTYTKVSAMSALLFVTFTLFIFLLPYII